MMIRKIKMLNFRGFRDKTINFDDKSVVLLSAANGIGKTTTVDAIEWCLTGNIGRLKTAFDARSTNDADRRMNNNGILKNRDAGANEKIRVVLWLVQGKQEKILCREQKNDELNPMVSRVTIDENEEKAKKFIQKYVGDSFYNFHFCDVQKSFNVQSKKRKDLKDFFGEFITNYDDKKQIAENLDIFAEDVDRYIEDKSKQKISQDVIKAHEEQLAEARDAAKLIPYPEISFYLGEKIKLDGLSKKELIAQKEKLVNCGYQIVNKGLFKLIENEKLKSEQLIIKKLAFYWEMEGETIQRAVNAGLLKNTDAIITREMKLRKLDELSFSKDTILQNSESIAALEVEGYKPSDFEENKNAIKEKEKLVKELCVEIELLTKNNKLLKLLSSLYANKQEVIEYRDTSLAENRVVSCPICGSSLFATIDENLILKEADDYIKRNGETVREKEVKKTSLETELAVLYQKIIDHTKNIVEKEKSKLQTEIINLKNLKNEIQSYADIVKNLQLIRKDINAEELTKEKIYELLSVVKSRILDESQEQGEREAYQQILTVLGYEFKNETMQQTCAKIKNLITQSFDVLNFSYDVFVSKLNAIDCLLASKTLSDLQQRLDEDNKKNQNIDEEIKKLQRLRESAFQRAKDIRNIIEKLSRDEYEKVGPAIGKFYNKLTRFNSEDGIKIVQENDGISLVDNKGKNIVNILSNGQISVLMLAHFFAAINARHDREMLKIYFIDDLTACMDDVNMLAFMDLLKYQMSSKATMDQLFFITCDDRISKLLKYKLRGCGIELCELLEADFT